MVSPMENNRSALNFCVFFITLPFYFWLVFYNFFCAVGKDIIERIWLYIETGDINPKVTSELNDGSSDSSRTPLISHR